MNACKFYKITKKAMELYLKGILDEESLTNIINKIRLENEFKNEDIYQETQLIKFLFDSRKYYEIEDFCDEFIIFIFNMPCTSKKLQADINLIVQSLETLNEKINFRILSQVDLHLYTLLNLNFITSLNEKNISIILENSSYMNDAIGVDIAEENAYEQYSIFNNFNGRNDDSREILSKNNEKIKSNIQRNINSLITKYYNVTTFERFINTFNMLIGNITLEDEKKEIISCLFNLKMKDYFTQARKNWQKKKRKAREAIKAYTLPLDY